MLSGIASARSAIERLSTSGIGVSIITVGELYEGAVLSRDTQGAFERYRQFLSAFSTLTLAEPTMQRFASIRALLRRTGNLIPDLDLLIAATALEHNLTLITRNLRHYERVSGLVLYREV